jgi:hypothetical protein
MEMPNFTDNQGASFIFDLDAKDSNDAPRAIGIEEEKTQMEALEFQRLAPNTHDLRYIEQLVSLQKEIVSDEIAEKKYNFDFEDADRARQ